ncbi:hypothetical protein NKI94_19190 [Mesorhizobium australicum]|uniref:DUF768 domain-containing protein n=1 Tax=Mesorhizobium australicum TaxID=536018 RepID=UPI0033354B22
MSTRGVNFLDKWLSSNVSGLASSDVISVAEDIQKLFADAKAIGISSTEIEEETGSVSSGCSAARIARQRGRDRRPVFFTFVPDYEGQQRERNRDWKPTFDRGA